MTVHESVSLLRRRLRLEALEIEAGLHACKLETSFDLERIERVSGLEAPPLPETRVEQAILDEAALRRCLEGGAFPVPEGFRGLVMSTAEARRILREEGFAALADPERREVFRCFDRRDFHDAFASGEMTAADLVRIDLGASRIFDRHGLPRPTAIEFDYVSGLMRDGAYDLERAAAHLLSRPDVELFPAGDRGRRGGAVSSPRDAVGDVPSWNRSPGCSRRLGFLWRPSEEDFAAAWAAARPRGAAVSDEDLRRAAFDLDLLGLRACGAARFAAYFESGDDGAEPDDDCTP